MTVNNRNPTEIYVKKKKYGQIQWIWKKFWKNSRQAMRNVIFGYAD